MTQPENRDEHPLFSFTPKELLVYMSELIDRIGRTGDRIQIYIDSSDTRTMMLKGLADLNTPDPFKDKNG
jgi:hypothetical protein